MRDFVFLGPSLPADRARELLPDAVFLPPVQLGDLHTVDVEPGDRVLIIDGLFLHSPAVRHRELLRLLERGVVVAGSSSMGALRAAELWPFGMRGFGRVFALYAGGTVTGDDEVAIVHGPAEDGYRAQSEPLVNIRLALADAVADRTLTDHEAQGLLHLVSGLPFRDRSYRALDLLADRTGDLGPAGRRFTTWRTTHPHDAKRQDAITLLEAAARRDPALRPHGFGDRPIHGVHTSYAEGWRAEFGGREHQGQWVADAQVAAAVRLMHPDFPRLHRADVIRRIAASLGVDDPADIPGAARSHGLVPPPHRPEAWSRLGTVALQNDCAVLELLVRTAGAQDPDADHTAALPEPLDSTATLDAARRLVVAATRVARGAAVTAGRPWPPPAPPGKKRPVRSPLRFRPEIVEVVLAALWSCSRTDLTDRAVGRGYPDLAAAISAAQPFVTYLRTFGAPSWPGRVAV